MKPIKFNLSNYLFKAPQYLPDCPDVPVLKDVRNGIVVSCWKMSWKERLSSLFLGKCWMITYHSSLPPIQLEIKKTLVKESKHEIA